MRSFHPDLVRFDAQSPILKMYRTKNWSLRRLPFCPMSLDKANPFLANCFIILEHMHGYAFCFRVIGSTNISRATSYTVLSQRLFLCPLEVLITLHVYPGLTLSSQMYATHDVRRLIFLRQDGRKFRVQASNFKQPKKALSRIRNRKKTVCK